LKNEQSTALRFVGDLELWQGFLLAAAICALTWLLYRREVKRGIQPPLTWLLPLLRTLALLLLVFTLTGPVLQHRQKIGQLGRLLLFIDGSKSMSVDDSQMMPDTRKLLAAQRHGWLPEGTLDTTLSDAADDLSTARTNLSSHLRTSLLTLETFLKARSEFTEQLEKIQEEISKVELPDTTPELRQGVLLKEVWEDINGGSINNLTSSPKYREDPDLSEYISEFDFPKNTDENYGLRISGFLIPPLTGEYTFQMNSDDEAALYLTANSTNPKQKKQILKTNNPNHLTSQPISLKAETPCYVELLFKEAGGDDFVNLSWTLPNQETEAPIPSNRLAAPENANTLFAGNFQAQIKRYHGSIHKRLHPSKLPQKDSHFTSDQLRALLISVTGEIQEFENVLRNAFDVQSKNLAKSGNTLITAALDKFDDQSRWQRTHNLLAGNNQLISQLLDTHDLEVFLLKGSSAERIWSPGEEQDESIDIPVEPAPEDPATNLSNGIRKTLSAEINPETNQTPDPENPPQKTAALLFSDGRHNDGQSPLHTAKLLGASDIAIHTIGMGGTTPPPDLAILEVENPDSVFIDDHIHGTVHLKDNIGKGRAFEIKIQHEGRIVWEKKLFTHNLQRRRIPFDFPIKAIVQEKIRQNNQEIDTLSLPISMQISIDPLEEETRKDNNDSPLIFRAITRKHRMLLLDGRPRWETRYIRNLFSRGQRWQVNAIFAGTASDTPELPRGDKNGQFPTTRDALYTYDLILFGELPANLLNETELGWIKDYVMKRGGGILFVDGPRQKLKEYTGTSILDLIPISWIPDAEIRFPQGLQITEIGTQQNALTLVSDPGENERLWKTLPQPHWVAPVEALPGTDVHLEALTDDARTPVIVTRKFGAGKVFYSGFDGSWRWRYGVAERYHTKYWHQVAEWIMERPFAVSDDHISIDAGSTVYRTGDSANLRVRLRDAEGNAIEEATAEALIWKEGRIISRVNLEPDKDTGGLFHGKSPALSEGRHEVSVNVTGFTEEQTPARTEFIVQPPDTGETALLACNEELLQQIAQQSGGQYLREEQTEQLPELLAPLSTGKIVESETILWQSYWWFGAILTLLSIEWFIRKRAGMM